MKYQAFICGKFVQDVEIINVPQVSIEEVAVITEDGNTAFVTGTHSWNKLESTSDMTLLYGKWFRLISDNWNIEDCIVCIDKKTIHFNRATKY